MVQNQAFLLMQCSTLPIIVFMWNGIANILPQVANFIEMVILSKKNIYKKYIILYLLSSVEVTSIIKGKGRIYTCKIKIKK